MGTFFQGLNSRQQPKPKLNQMSKQITDDDNTVLGHQI